MISMARMSRLWTVLLTGLALLSAGSTRAQTIKVSPESIDFGRMNQNETATATVTLTNVGSELLELQKPKASCGCTVPQLAKNQLKPGESTEMQVMFNSKDFVGPQKKVVHIISNDAQAGDFQLPLTVDVHVPIIVNPPKKMIHNRSLKFGEVWSQTVTFTSTEVPQLELTLADYPEQKYRVEITNGADGDPHLCRMVVTTREDLISGDHSDVIRVSTNVAAMPSIDIMTWINVQGDLEVDRKILRFFQASAGEQLRDEVRVVSRNEELDFSITGAEIDLPEFEAEVVTLAPAKDQVVKISGRALPASDERMLEARGRRSGTLRIFTDLPTQPELQVKVVYMVRS